MLYRSLLPYSSDASEYYTAIADLPWAVWLDSGGRGRYDILTAQPVKTLVTQGETTRITDSTGEYSSVEDPFRMLREMLGIPLEKMNGIKFAGGALGYWGYDLARRYSRLPNMALDAEGIPEMAVAIYDWALQIDHQEKTAQLVSYQHYPQTVEIIPQIIERLQRSNGLSAGTFHVHGDVTSNFSRSSYDKAFETVHAYLQAGDCYQINLAQRFSAQASGDAYAAYRTLRQLSP